MSIAPPSNKYYPYRFENVKGNVASFINTVNVIFQHLQKVKNYEKLPAGRTCLKALVVEPRNLGDISVLVSQGKTLPSSPTVHGAPVIFTTLLISPWKLVEN